MTEPTLEEMKKSVLGVYPEAILVRTMRDRRVENGIWCNRKIISAICISAKMAWDSAYSRLPPQPAPESEDEAFERWFKTTLHAMMSDCRSQYMREAWNARARLSAGGK